MADRGHAQNPMQAVNTSAEPSHAARASLPRSIQRPTCSAVNTRDDGETCRDNAEPEDGEAEFDRAVGGRDPDDERERLDQRDVGEKRDEQAVIDVPLRGQARARLLGHQ